MNKLVRERMLFLLHLAAFLSIDSQDLLSTRDICNLRDLRTANLPLVMVVGGALDSFEHLMCPYEKNTHTHIMFDIAAGNSRSASAHTGRPLAPLNTVVKTPSLEMNPGYK